MQTHAAWFGLLGMSQPRPTIQVSARGLDLPADTIQVDDGEKPVVVVRVPPDGDIADRIPVLPPVLSAMPRDQAACFTVRDQLSLSSTVSSRLMGARLEQFTTLPNRPFEGK